MNEKELAAVLDSVNKEIEEEDKKRYVRYADGGKFFSMKSPEKEAWLEEIKENGG